MISSYGGVPFDTSGNIEHPAGIRSISPSRGIGYMTGAGGSVTQLTSKSTGITLNKVSGQITLHGAALAAATSVSFILTNSSIAATDVVLVNIASGSTLNVYTLTIDQVAVGSCRIQLRNISISVRSEALVLNFIVFKGAIS